MAFIADTFLKQWIVDGERTTSLVWTNKLVPVLIFSNEFLRCVTIPSCSRDEKQSHRTFSSPKPSSCPNLSIGVDSFARLFRAGAIYWRVVSTFGIRSTSTIRCSLPKLNRRQRPTASLLSADWSDFLQMSCFDSWTMGCWPGCTTSERLWMITISFITHTCGINR